MTRDKDVTDQFSPLAEINMTPSEQREIWGIISQEIHKVKPRRVRRKKNNGFAAGAAAVASVAIIAGGFYVLSNHRLLNPTTASNQPTPPPPVTSVQKAPPLTAIDMVNGTTGWAAARGTVWLTTDGGANWKNVSPKGLPTSSTMQLQVYGLGNTDAWVTDFDSSTVSNPIAIYHTSDGGQSWVKQQIHDVGDAMRLHFRDENHGWIALMQGASMGSERETIYQTNDGGATWNKVSVTNDVQNGTLPFGGDKTGVSFIDDNHGWATGFTPMDGQIYLYKTINGGKTWQQEKLTVPSSPQGAQFTSYPPVFFSQQDGILPVSFGSGLLTYRTTDGGKTWIPGTPAASTVQNQAIQAWSFPTMDNGFTTDGTKLFATKDGGQTWTSFTPNISLINVTILRFTSQSDGWALMSSGALYHTTDGGHTWKRSN